MFPFALLITPFLCQLFSAVNEVDSHNKSRQSGLALDKWCVTQCGWLRLFTTVATGMTITNYCKLFRYRVKRYHYKKLIGIREFSERLDQDCFNNHFPPEIGSPEKNVHPFDEVDDGDTVSTPGSGLGPGSVGSHKS